MSISSKLLRLWNRLDHLDEACPAPGVETVVILYEKSCYSVGGLGLQTSESQACLQCGLDMFIIWALLHALVEGF